MDQLFWSVLAGFVASGLVFGGQKLYARYLDNVIVRFWGKKRKSAVIPVYRNVAGDTVPEKFARIDDALAVDEIASSLSGVGIEYQIYNHDQQVPDETDLILICAPKANTSSRSFYEDNEDSLPFCIESVDNTFVFHLGHKQLEVTVPVYSPSDGLSIRFSPASSQAESGERTDEKKNEDIGLICRWTKEGRRIFLFWGVHGIGTLAAARYVSDRNMLKSLVKEVGDRDFCVVVKAAYKSSWQVGQASRYSPIVFREDTPA